MATMNRPRAIDKLFTQCAYSFFLVSKTGSKVLSYSLFWGRKNPLAPKKNNFGFHFWSYIQLSTECFYCTWWLKNNYFFQSLIGGHPVLFILLISERIEQFLFDLISSLEPIYFLIIKSVMFRHQLVKILLFF